MVEHFDALEADFALYYRIDLRDALWRRGMGLRRLWNLVKGLPVDSAFARGIITPDKPQPASADEMRSFFGGNVVVSGGE